VDSLAAECAARLAMATNDDYSEKGGNDVSYERAWGRGPCALGAPRRRQGEAAAHAAPDLKLVFAVTASVAYTKPLAA